MRASLFLVVMLVGALALRGGPARGGEGAAGGKVSVVAEAPIALSTTVRAEFRGETVGQALALVEDALGGKVQFFVSPAVRDVPMPHLKATETRLHGLLSLMVQLVRDLRVRVRVGGASFDDVISIDQNQETLAERFPNAKETVIVLAELAEEEFDTGERIERRLRVYRVSDVLATSVTVDDLATAIETAWQSEGARHHATLKFHKETGLLICSGTPQHLLLVEQVLEGVSKQPRSTFLFSRLDELGTKVADLQQVLAKAAETDNVRAQTVARLEARVAQLEAQMKALAAKEK